MGFALILLGVGCFMNFRATDEQQGFCAYEIVVSDSGYGFPIFHESLDTASLQRTILGNMVMGVKMKALILWIFMFRYT